VIIDRYYFSTMAYQGARGISPAELMNRNEQFAPQPICWCFSISTPGGFESNKNSRRQSQPFRKHRHPRKSAYDFQWHQKTYLFRLDGNQEQEVLRALIVRQFSAIYAERITRSNLRRKKNLPHLKSFWRRTISHSISLSSTYLWRRGPGEEVQLLAG